MVLLHATPHPIPKLSGLSSAQSPFSRGVDAALFIRMGHFADLAESLRAFTPQERRNIAFYIVGIMIYKFGLEAFNGSIIALATNRYDYEAFRDGTPSRTFERVGLLTGLNQAFQCIGSILIGPLVCRFILMR